MLTETELMHYLETNNLTFERSEHPAVFTCAEAELHRPHKKAVSTKNLFLCDKKARRFFLLVTACEKTMDLLKLAAQIGAPHLRFASEENLERVLGVTRGSVTMMALVNDTGHQVELWLDEEIWSENLFQSHPLVNTATLLLEKETLKRFFSLTGHEIHLLQC